MRFKYLLILSMLLSVVAGSIVAQDISLPTVKKITHGRFIEDWIVLGPIPLYEEDSVRRELVQKFLFEHLFADSIVTNPIVSGYSRYDWSEAHADSHGRIMLSSLYATTNQMYSYSLCLVESHDSAKVLIGFGSNDDAEIWINGALVHQICRGRMIVTDDDIVPVQLIPGRNIILVRVDNRGADWGFCFRFIDKETETRTRKLREFDAYKKYAPLDLAIDAAVLHASLVDLHPGYGRYTHKTTVDAQFFALQKELAMGDSLTIKEFLRKVLPVLALIKDAHTMLWPDDKYFINDYRFVPLELRIIDGRLVVAKLFDAQLHHYQMSELLTIDGMPASVFLAEAEKIIPRDGYSQSFLGASIANYALLNLLCNLLFMDSDNLEITVRNQDGTESTIPLYNFSSCNARYVKPDIDVASEPISQYVDTALNFCYLAVNSFWPQWCEKKGISYEKSIDKLFAGLRDRTIDNLIIDLRYNSGGDYMAAVRLLTYLIPKKTVYLSGARINEQLLQPKYIASGALREMGANSGYLKFMDKAWVHNMVFERRENKMEVKERHLPRIATIEPSKHGFSGTIYVMTSGNTADVASDFCASLRNSNKAIFIGQETGGAQDGGCGGFYFPLRLPATSCKIWIPTVQTDINTPAHSPGRGVIPDHAVIPAPVRRAHADDPELQKAIDLIRNQRNVH